MNRRSLLKILGLLPFVGPALAKTFESAAIQPKLFPFLPKHFPKWNPAVDGLEDAGIWALGLEKERLPKNVAFPRAGQIWECICDCQVGFRPCIRRSTFLSADPASAVKHPPFAPDDLLVLLGGHANFPAGERIRVVGAETDKPLHVSFIPLRYQELQNHIVPEEILHRPDYQGYELSLKTARTISDFGPAKAPAFFTEVFRLVE